MLKVKSKDFERFTSIDEANKAFDAGDFIDCPQCLGEGEIEKVTPDGFHFWINCPKCDGLGILKDIKEGQNEKM